MKIRKGKKIIDASKKAYRVVYKAAGYVPVAQEETKEQKQEPQGKQVELDELKVDELKTLAKARGIEGAESLKREELLEVLKDVE